MATTSSQGVTVDEVLTELAALGDEKRRQHNARVGPDGIAGVPLERQFGVRTGDIRVVAKRLKTNPELGFALWKTGNFDAQLLAILLFKPKALTGEEIDTLVRQARFTWVADWLGSSIISLRSDEEREAWRTRWMEDRDGWVRRAGWNLTASKVKSDPGSLAIGALLDRLEKEMPAAPPETRWAMNNTLGAIGINVPGFRERAVAVGERMGWYKDWPRSKGCIIPYVPEWVEAMVARGE